MGSPSSKDPSAPGETGKSASPIGTSSLAGIASHLAELAEKDGNPEDRRREVLLYLRQIFRAEAILYSKPLPGRILHQESLWANDSLARQLQPALIQLGSLMVRTSRTRQAALSKLPGLPHLHGLAVPLVHRGKLVAIVSLMRSCEPGDDPGSYLAILQTALGYLHYSLLREETHEDLSALEQSAALVELITDSAAAPHFEEAARRLTTRLQKHLQCSQVVLARIRRDRIHLLSFSGTPLFHTRSRNSELLRGAMSETARSARQLCAPAPLHEPSDSTPLQSEEAHEELIRQTKSSAALSTPLTDENGNIRAILTVLWEESPAPVLRTARFLRAAAPSLGTILPLLRKADPVGSRRWIHVFWSQLGPRRKQMTLAIILLILTLLSWPVSYPIRTSVKTEPTERRVLAAPFEGILKEVFVEAGDSVNAGEPLALLDDQELRWRHAELRASLQKAIHERDQEMAAPDQNAVSIQMAQLEVDRLALDLQLVENRLELLEIRAPIHGVILSGDLRQALGVPVQTGQVLLEMAPLDRLRARLFIPGHAITLLPDPANGTPVEIRLASHPGREWQGVLTRLHPQAIISNGQTGFEAEASFDAETQGDELLPGMRGRATIQGKRSPVIWILFRRFAEYLHLRFG
ncbi:MAG: efflux RND transporter periplasmic adaptor subunit [Puniceicoccales bacterium]